MLRWSLDALFIFGLLFLWSNGFALNAFSFSSDFRILQLACMFLIFGVSLVLVLWKPNHPAFHNYFALGILSIIGSALLTSSYYLVLLNELPITEILRVNLLFPGLFSFFILSVTMNSHGAAYRVARIVIWVLGIYIAILLFISQDRMLADTIMVRTSERFGFTRINLSNGLSLFGLFFFYSMLVQFSQPITRKSKLWALAGVILYVLYFTTTDLTRQNLIGYAISLSIFFTFYSSGTRRLTTILWVSLFGIYIFLAPQMSFVRTGLERSLLSMVSEYGEDAGTVGVRLEGIAFNFQIFSDTGFIGIGTRSDNLPSNDPYFYGRELFGYHAGDHGIPGVLYRYGLIGLLVTIFVLYRCFRDLRYVRRYGTPAHMNIALAIHFVLLHLIFTVNQMFWEANHAGFYGVIFFLIWRMKRDTIQQNFNFQTQSKNGVNV